MNNSSTLKGILKKLAASASATGLIPFEKFMEIALYDPDVGYYTKTPQAIGSKGDFVTSAHTSEIFGALLGRQIEELADILDEKKFYIVEMGAGAGYLALDILNYLSKGKLIEKIRYFIIEPFSYNIKFQQKLLEKFSGLVEWVSSIAELNVFSGCFLSNELIDSFPVHVVEMTERGFKEVYVNFDENSIIGETLLDIHEPELKKYLENLSVNLPPGYRTEVNLRLKNWLKDVARVLKKGFVITIDYGYPKRDFFSKSRNRGTLMCYKKHKVCSNPYQEPGKVDITAHVNFSDLAAWGKKFSLVTLGYANQSSFLVSLDIEDVMKKINNGKRIEPFSKEASAIKSLLLPHGMGESHKVIVQGKNIDQNITLKGFAMINKKILL